MRSALLGLLAQTHGVLAQPPLLLVYGEAACPDTRAFILGPLTDAVEAFGPVNSTSWPLALFYLPWGNAYYLTSECPGGVPSPPHCHDSASCLYNSSVRTCFDASCGKGAHAPPSDCYNGKPRCQHGHVECLSNRVQACALVQSPLPWAFLRCFFSAYEDGTLKAGNSTDDEVLAAGRACAVDDPSLDWAPIETCADPKNAQGDVAIEAAAKATPPHPGTPFALLDDAIVDTKASGGALVQTICAAIKKAGYDLPKACAKEQLSVEA